MIRSSVMKKLKSNVYARGPSPLRKRAFPNNGKYINTLHVVIIIHSIWGFNGQQSHEYWQHENWTSFFWILKILALPAPFFFYRLIIKIKTETFQLDFFFAVAAEEINSPLLYVGISLFELVVAGLALTYSNLLVRVFK